MNSNSILFGTPPLKAQNHKIWPFWPSWLFLCSNGFGSFHKIVCKVAELLEERGSILLSSNGPENPDSRHKQYLTDWNGSLLDAQTACYCM